MKFLIFIFKHRFRRNSLNNFLKCRKIKNIIIFNFSGPLFHFFGKILYYIIRNKKFVFISCDGLDFLKREANSINFWMGGTSYKIPKEYKKYKNNFVAASTIFSDQSKLLLFYPTKISKNIMKKEFKFVYVSDYKKIENQKSLIIWEKIKNQILSDLSLVDDINFWGKLIDDKSELAQKIYIDVKSLIRQEMVKELHVRLNDKFILVGSDWKKIFPSALESNFSNKFIENIYKGNICVDFGSKNSEQSIYPRSCKIIESGGILFQSIHKDSRNIFRNLFERTCFKSLLDMNQKIDFFLDKKNDLNNILNIQRNNFEGDELNYKTLKQINNHFL